MKIQSVKKSKANYSLLLVIFLFICSFSSLFSQSKDTLWTRNLQPYYIINGVFSPDDQYIYVTTTSPYYVLKYDLQGNQLWESDTLGGIRQFSEDGRFFWNYYGDKYDANTFQKLFKFADGKFNINGWQWSINEKSEIGILSGTGKITETQTQNFFDSNLVEFNLNTMQIIKFISHYNKAFWISHPTINPDGTKLAIITGMEKKNYKNEIYTDSLKIEIRSLPELIKEKEIELQLSKTTSQVELKYSPDGSVLGYQHDGKLTLYSTIDYSVVWESGNFGIYNFSWSNDMSTLYWSTGILGMNKLKYSDKSLIHNYLWVVSSKFIEFDRLNRYILVGNGSFGLLDNSITSIKDDFFDKIKINLNLNQNQTTNEFAFKINSPEPAVGYYTITNMLGEIMQNPIQINISEGSNQFELNTEDFPAGIYFLTLTISGKTQTLKFGVVR